MTELTRHLDKVPAEVPVVVVMVQCYSGGFANLIFRQGDPLKGLARANRCGFYATVETRPAAGCTPDINEENYQEYSSYFWAAMLGATRTGQAVSSCDYNEDGVVSFAEAQCVQCGLCRNTCPESVISLEPRLSFKEAALAHQIIKEEEPFKCIRCSKEFGTKSTIERMVAKLEGHPMFGDAGGTDRLKMCEDCRVIAIATDDEQPMAMGSVPVTRTTDDYLRERDARVIVVAMRQVADWMDAGSESRGGPTNHEAESIGMEISGPTQCSAADRCYRAGMRAFREAASIWERRAARADRNCPDGLTCDYSRKGGNCGDPLCQSAGGEA